MFLDVTVNGNAQIFLLDGEGRLLSSSNEVENEAKLSQLHRMAVENQSEKCFEYIENGSKERYVVLTRTTKQDRILIQTFPQKIMLQQAEQMRTVIWEAGIVCAVLLLIIIVFISYTITKPLKQVEVGLKRIAGGDFNTKIPYAGNDEIGNIARACDYIWMQARLLLMATTCPQCLISLTTSPSRIRPLLLNPTPTLS